MLGFTRALSFLTSNNFPRKPTQYRMLFSLFLEVPRTFIYTKLPTSKNRAGVTKKPAGWVAAPQHEEFTGVKNPHCIAKETAKVAFVYCYVMSRYIHTWTYLNTVKGIIERPCQNTYSCLPQMYCDPGQSDPISRKALLGGGSWGRHRVQNWCGFWEHSETWSPGGKQLILVHEAHHHTLKVRAVEAAGLWQEHLLHLVGREAEEPEILYQLRPGTRGLWHSTVVTINWCWKDTGTLKQILLLF